MADVEELRRLDFVAAGSSRLRIYPGRERRCCPRGDELDLPRAVRCRRSGRSPAEDRRDRLRAPAFQMAKQRRSQRCGYCVIVGLRNASRTAEAAFRRRRRDVVPTTSTPILFDGPTVLRRSRRTVSLRPAADGSTGTSPTTVAISFYPPEEREEMIARDPAAARFIRPFMGSTEVIEGYRRDTASGSTTTIVAEADRIPRYCRAASNAVADLSR